VYIGRRSSSIAARKNCSAQAGWMDFLPHQANAVRGASGTERRVFLLYYLFGDRNQRGDHSRAEYFKTNLRKTIIAARQRSLHRNKDHRHPE
jgi:hypothetical protein